MNTLRELKKLCKQWEREAETLFGYYEELADSKDSVVEKVALNYSVRHFALKNCARDLEILIEKLVLKSKEQDSLFQKKLSKAYRAGKGGRTQC